MDESRRMKTGAKIAWVSFALAIMFGAVGLGVWQWQEHTLQQSYYTWTGLGLILVGIGIWCLILSFLLAFQDAHIDIEGIEGGGCLLVLLILVIPFLGIYWAIAKPYPAPLLSPSLCMDLNSDLVNGGVVVTPRKFAVGEEGTLLVGLQNTGTKTMQLDNPRVDLGQLHQGFLVDYAAIPSSGVQRDGQSNKLIVDQVVLEPGKQFTKEIPLIATNFGNYKGISVSSLVRLGEDGCGQLRIKNEDELVVVP